MYAKYYNNYYVYILCMQLNGNGSCSMNAELCTAIYSLFQNGWQNGKWRDVKVHVTSSAMYIGVLSGTCG